MDNVKLEKLATMTCEFCHGSSFSFYIGTAIDSTFLMISCNNKECKKQQSYLLQNDNETISVAEIFDITGQRYDLLKEENLDTIIEEKFLN